MAQGLGRPPRLEDLPEVLFIGSESRGIREVRREDIEKLTPEERENLWYDGPVPGRPADVACIFPFFDDTGAFACDPPKPETEPTAPKKPRPRPRGK